MIGINKSDTRFNCFIGALAVFLFLMITTGLYAEGAMEAGPRPDLVVVNMADTHSAYDTYPAILKRIANLAQHYGDKPMVILFDGDLFESGNIVANKSGGTPDLEFINRLTEYGKVIINVGNHEFDLMSPAEFRNAAESAGAIVIGTVNSKGDSLLPIYTDLRIGDRRIRIIGIGVDALNTYPKPLRESLEIPEPTEWLKKNYDELSDGAESIIIASHAGLVPDLSMLDYLSRKDSILFMVGAHDHITLREEINGIPYLHNGFRGERFNIAEVSFSDGETELVFRDIITDGIEGEDSQMAAFIEDAREKHLDSTDLEIIGMVPKEMTVFESTMWAVETVRNATGADAAFLNHSSFGSGLSEGPLMRYRFNQFMRFDNDVMSAEVDAETLRTILSTCNQHNQDDIYKRSGDFLYTGDIEVEDGKTYKIVTSSWVALDFNQMKYLGVSIEFTKIPNITTKGIIEAELKKQ